MGVRVPMCMPLHGCRCICEDGPDKRIYVYACMPVYMQVDDFEMRVCVYACMRVCVYACMRASKYDMDKRVCVYACMRVGL
jgi:hypothetical protein